MAIDSLPYPCEMLARTNREAGRIAEMSGGKRSLWQNLDDFIHEMRKAELYNKNTLKTIDWPDSVFMPYALWGPFIERHFRFPEGSFSLNETEGRGMAQLLAALAPWRATQDIIRFDPDILAELLDMDMPGKLPSELLARLPAWCVWVDAPLKVDGDDFIGFFAQLDVAEVGLCLAMTFQTGDRRQQRVTVALGDFTLEASLAATNRAGAAFNEDPVMTDDPGIRQAVNLVTYICSYGLADRQGYVPSGKEYPKPVKTKKGWRIFPPRKSSVHVLGTGFGDIMRKAGTGAGGSSGARRPHVRRAHWHHFWTGSGQGKELIAHFLPPMRVGDPDRHARKAGGKAAADE